MRKDGEKEQKVEMRKSSKNEKDEYVTVKVRKSVKDTILEIQGLLQYRDHKHYTHSDIIEYALSLVPELQIPLDQKLRLIREEAK